MRIENITDKTLKNLLDDELSHLRSRCLNIFDRYFARSDVQKAVGMDRRWFLTKYLLLRSEMENRGIKLFRERPLDKEVHNRIFKTLFWNLDVPALGDMIAIPNYVSVCGEFIKSPLATEKVDIVIRTAKEHRNEVFEAKIAELVKEQTNKEPNFIYEPKGPNKSYIPLFDLILKSHEETRKVKNVKKMVIVEKAAIAFKDLDTAEEATVWAGAKETVKADVDDLKQICAWYDSSKPDIKSSYKLPHHRMSDKKAVWRAVSAAMAALLGARGGVDIPDADRKGAYNHLMGHYRQFDKEVPELKKYDAEELEKVFPIEKLTATQRIECDEETARIKENKKLLLAGEIHEFKSAKYTHPNGHPRCLVCGDEESIGQVCNMTKVWYLKHDWDDEEAWTEERKKLKASGKLKKSFPIKKPEENNTIRIPVGPDCEVTATITIDKGQGISALYCGKIKTIRTFLFDKRVKTWTMASARAWIKEHKEKTALDVKKGNINKPQKCHWCEEVATKAYIWADGRAYIPTCSEHIEKTKKQIEITNKDGITAVRNIPLKAEKGTMFKIIKIDKAKRLAGGIVYEPETEDTQGDLASKGEIEKALHGFMKRYATDTKRIKINHKGKRYFFPIIESFIPEEDIVKGGDVIPAGAWWLMIHISNDKMQMIWIMSLSTQKTSGKNCVIVAFSSLVGQVFLVAGCWRLLYGPIKN